MTTPITSTPLLDSHIHLFRGGFTEVYNSAFANRDEVSLYEAFREVHNIERALVIGYEGSPQFEGNSHDLAGWAQQHDWITPLEYYHADRPPQAAELKDECRNIFAGISLYVMSPQEAEMILAWPHEIFHDLNERQAIVSLNAAPEILEALADFPHRLENCRLLVSHCGSPGSYDHPPETSAVLQRLEPLRRLSTLPHVGVKLSALYAMSNPMHDYPHHSAHPFLNQLRDDFGAHRLYWGSDFSPALEYVSFAQTIDAIKHLDWPEAELTAIFGGNLQKLLADKN